MEKVHAYREGILGKEGRENASKGKKDTGEKVREGGWIKKREGEGEMRR